MWWWNCPKCGHANFGSKMSESQQCFCCSYVRGPVKFKVKEKRSSAVKTYTIWQNKNIVGCIELTESQAKKFNNISNGIYVNVK